MMVSTRGLFSCLLGMSLLAGGFVGCMPKRPVAETESTAAVAKKQSDLSAEDLVLMISAKCPKSRMEARFLALRATAKTCDELYTDPGLKKRWNCRKGMCPPPLTAGYKVNDTKEKLPVTLIAEINGKNANGENITVKKNSENSRIIKEIATQNAKVTSGNSEASGTSATTDATTDNNTTTDTVNKQTGEESNVNQTNQELNYKIAATISLGAKTIEVTQVECISPEGTTLFGETLKDINLSCGLEK